MYHVLKSYYVVEIDTFFPFRVHRSPRLSSRFGSIKNWTKKSDKSKCRTVYVMHIMSAIESKKEVVSIAQHWAHWEIIRVRVVICWCTTNTSNSEMQTNFPSCLHSYAHEHTPNVIWFFTLHVYCYWVWSESMCVVVSPSACVIDRNAIKFWLKRKKK